MKFRLSLWPPCLEIETPAPEQVSTIDLVAAVIHTMTSQMEPFDMVAEGEAGD